MKSANSEENRQIIYLVYAPERVEWSAGIKVLYKLYEAIQENGRVAILVNHGRSSFRKKWELYLKIRKLNKNFKNYIFVAIYTESIVGNPLEITSRIRWILNYPSLLGGNARFPSEIILAYSKNISNFLSKKYDLPSRILFIPALNVSEIEKLSSADESITNSSYELLYAQKFRALGGKPFVDVSSIIEVTRFDRNATKRVETLNLIRNATKLHVFENSTIITEAQICGVPVFCYESETFSELIAEHELGNEGISWDSKKAPVLAPELIKARCLELELNYKRRVQYMLNEVEADIQKIEHPAEKIQFNPFTGPISHKYNRFMALARNRSLATALRFVGINLKRSIR